MVITGTVIVWWQLVLWLCGLALLGVVIALPWKQLFVNRENYPFPEGTASAVAIKALYGGEKSELVDSQSESRWFGSATKQLLAFAAFAGIARLLQSTTIVTKLGISFLRLPEMLDDWYWKLSATHGWWSPSIAGATLRELTIRPSVDFALLGIGGLMGIRTGVSLLVGAFINYAVLAPWMVSRGDIASEVDSNGHLLVGFRSITTWSLWTGVALMTSAALWSLLVQRKAVSSLLDRRTWLLSSDNQESANEEIPFQWGWPAALIGALLVIWIGMIAFEISIPFMAIAIAMAMLTSIIGINTTAITSMTPTGALGRIAQLVFGLVVPKSIGTNVAAAGLSAEVALQASTFTQVLKTAHLLGAKPRLVVVGHLLGAFFGALVSVLVFYGLFLKGSPDGLISDEFPFPAAVVWQAVAELFANGIGSLPRSAVWAATIAILIGISMQVLSHRKKWFPLSPLAMGLAFVLPFHVSFAVFTGAFIFWILQPKKNRNSKVREFFTSSRETICAGIIAGAAMAGVIVLAIEAFIG